MRYRGLNEHERTILASRRRTLSADTVRERTGRRPSARSTPLAPDAAGNADHPRHRHRRIQTLMAASPRIRMLSSRTAFARCSTGSPSPVEREHDVACGYAGCSARARSPRALRAGSSAAYRLQAREPAAPLRRRPRRALGAPSLPLERNGRNDSAYPPPRFAARVRGAGSRVLDAPARAPSRRRRRASVYWVNARRSPRTRRGARNAPSEPGADRAGRGERRRDARSNACRVCPGHRSRAHLTLPSRPRRRARPASRALRPTLRTGRVPHVAPRPGTIARRLPTWRPRASRSLRARAVAEAGGSRDAPRGTARRIACLDPKLYAGYLLLCRDRRRRREMREMIGNERRVKSEAIFRPLSAARPALVRWSAPSVFRHPSSERRRGTFALRGRYVEVDVGRASNERITVQPLA